MGRPARFSLDDIEDRFAQSRLEEAARAGAVDQLSELEEHLRREAGRAAGADRRARAEAAGHHLSGDAAENPSRTAAASP